ncbi:SigE family RNA polymerase sigma factor [Micromonospora sp. NPDC093244]|uniref:SigE family RNA polymerase sigma factor n=1 Tax=Micromonospora sp. NPDC093244 TaxID=3155071 RepID=UPI0034178885
MLHADEFDEFYTSTYRRLVGQLYAMLGDLSEAEDAVQEAYCRAWQRRSKLNEYDNPEAWVRTVAYRIAVSSWRRTRNRLAAHRRHGPHQPVESVDTGDLDLVGALAGLPYEQRRVLVLHHLVGLPLADICRETGSPLGTVKSRLARGRQALAQHAAEFRGTAHGRISEDV